MIRRKLAVLGISAYLMMGLTACSGEGANASCNTSAQCTVTFDRSVADANISVLGVEIKVVSATDSTVTLDVAGQQVTVENNQSVDAGGLQLKLQSITDKEIVVQVGQA